MKITVLHLIIITGLFAHLAHSWTPKPVDEDPLVRMPGTQPGQVVDLESDKQCLSCHGGATYEMDNWKGSLMAQAGRDPIFWAGLTVAAQDAIYVLGTPNAADICVKCHFPQGWLDGRSDPVNCTSSPISASRTRPPSRLRRSWTSRSCEASTSARVTPCLTMRPTVSWLATVSDRGTESTPINQIFVSATRAEVRPAGRHREQYRREKTFSQGHRPQGRAPEGTLE